MNTVDRAELRREMRRKRRGLTVQERKEAGCAVLSHLQSLIRFRRGMRVGVYLSHGGEVDTQPIIELARKLGCFIYVPIVGRERCVLRFVALAGLLRSNRFGILEPRFFQRKTLDPRFLDVVLMPLLAFGSRGERLGSGAGFYDQTFAFLPRRRAWKKPKLIGLAYHWQASSQLASEAWDVPMWAVATERAAFRFS
jgi:5-formyltetrahydrofolate cyclo-ligase